MSHMADAGVKIRMPYKMQMKRLNKKFTLCQLLLCFSENMRSVLINRCGYRGRLEDERHDIGDLKAFRKEFLNKLLVEELADQDFCVFDETYVNIVDINWPLINRLFWKKFDHTFFTITPKATSAINELYQLDANDQYDESTWLKIADTVSIMTTTADLYALIDNFSFIDAKYKAKLIQAYINRSHQYQREEKTSTIVLKINKTNLLTALNEVMPGKVIALQTKIVSELAQETYISYRHYQSLLVLHFKKMTSRFITINDLKN